MKWASRFTTEQFRSRCAKCPDRGFVGCALAAAVLGEDYRADNCEGPQTVVNENTVGVLGEGFAFSMTSVSVRRDCGQDPTVITGQIVENGSLQGVDPQPGLAAIERPPEPI